MLSAVKPLLCPPNQTHFHKISTFLAVESKKNPYAFGKEKQKKSLYFLLLYQIISTEMEKKILWSVFVAGKGIFWGNKNDSL